MTLPTVRLHQGRKELQAAGQPPVPWPRVAAGLGATHLLTGTCTGPATGTTIALELTPLAGGAAAETTLPPGRLFDVLDEATRWVLAQLQVDSLPKDVSARLFAPPSDSTTAVEYYAKAIAAARQDELKDALRYADAALTSDRRYRPALGLMAQVELQLGPSGRLSARRHLRALRNLARRDDDLLDGANAELALSLIDLTEGNPQAARTRGKTALDLARTQADIHARIAALSWLCDLHVTWATPIGDQANKQHIRDQLEQAAEYQARSLTILTALNDRIGALPATSKLALIYEQLERPDDALKMHQRTLALAKALDSRKHRATAWLYLGRWHRKQAQWGKAIAATRKCLDLADDDAKPTVHIALGELLTKMDHPAEALAEYNAAYKQLQTGDDLMRQYTCVREIAQLEKTAGNHAVAVARLQEAVDLAAALRLAEHDELAAQLAEWRRSGP